MTKPVIAEASPIGVEVTAGRKYRWCACGLSKKQPFCDESHAGTGIEPLVWTAPATEEVWFCRCKQTADAPLCDGTHNGLGK